MNTETYLIPDFYLSALFNGDESGLSDEDTAALTSFTNDRLKEFKCLHAIGCDEEPKFTAWHDFRIYGVLACNCVNVTFDIGS